MLKFSYFRKGALLGVLFLLQACSKQAPEWMLISSHSSEPYFVSSRLYFQPENIFREPGFEIICDSMRGSRSRFFINVYGCPVRTTSESPNTAEVILTIDGYSETFMAHVFQGNQRLLLPDEISDKIIQGLLNRHSVSLKFDNYHGELTQYGFVKKYNRLLKSVSNEGLRCF